MHQLNIVIPVFFIAVLLLTSYSLLRIIPESIWTGLVWFPIASATFYGFGALVEVLGNEITKQALSAHPLFVDTRQLWLSNQLSALGVTFVTIGIWAQSALAGAFGRPAVHCFDDERTAIAPAALAVLFLVTGGLLKYGLMNPAQWGMIDVLIPGSLGQLAVLVDIGFAILAFLAVRNRARGPAIGCCLLFPLHLYFTVIGFAKLEIMLAMLLPVVGAYVGHRRISILGVSLVVMATAFVFSQDLVRFGRHQILLDTGVIDQASYGRRVAILNDYLGGARIEDVGGEAAQGWWTRLNFSGVQAFAIGAREVGLPAFNITRAWMYFVPRAVWPEKPIMHSPSREFYAMVTGNAPTSALALSIYGDLYWQYGWLGVVAGCILIGWLYAMMARRTLQAVLRRDYIMLPVIL
ncbi:MAG: hypothetical protein AAGF46_07030, partial [Pseudomonadota bacterium]